MNGIALFNALTKIDDRFIDRAEKAPAVPERPRRAPVLRWVEIAACACLLLTVSLLIANRIGLFGRPGGGKGSGYNAAVGSDVAAATEALPSSQAGTQAGVTEGTGAVDEENVGYHLSVVDGRTYLNFDGGNAASSSIKGTVYFDTVDEMVTAIRTNSLSPAQCETIRNSFPRDGNGFRIIDLDHVCDAVLPDGLFVRRVDWDGPSYAIEFDGEDSVSGLLRVLTPKDYAEVFAYEYETFFDRANVTVISREHDAERDAEVVLYETSGGSFQAIRYTLPNGVTAVETYSAPGGTPLAVPDTVYLYGETETAAFRAHIIDLTERPSVEWLSRFGLSER